MILFAHTITPRLEYVVDFISKYFQTNINIVCDEDKYRRSDDPHKFNYSYHQLAKNEFWIHSHSLLFESSIRPVKAECFQHNNYKVFFKAEGDIPFDVLAATFYLITRYEEYLPHQKDMYGRYDHKNSLAYKESFLHLPLINIWLEDLRVELEKKFTDLKLPHNQFQFLPTYDIDMAWTYRNKGFKRNAGGLFLSFIKGRWRRMAERLSVIRRKKEDPFNSYEWMNSLHERYNLKPIYFFLFAEKSSKYDKNISLLNPEFKHLVHSIASENKVGLHPSWASNFTPALLEREKHALEEVAQQHIQQSRQHYIKFELPQTFQYLLNIGIIEDYSMGYGSINGFRASVATPFDWYDLKNEQKTTLKMFPFCFMDANSYYEQQQTPDAALEELQQLKEVIKSVNGTMITIWHNSFLGTSKEFEGWKEAYEKFIASVNA